MFIIIITDSYSLLQVWWEERMLQCSTKQCFEILWNLQLAFIIPYRGFCDPHYIEVKLHLLKTISVSNIFTYVFSQVIPHTETHFVLRMEMFQSASYYMFRLFSFSYFVLLTKYWYFWFKEPFLKSLIFILSPRSIDHRTTNGHEQCIVHESFLVAHS